jgi:hypothetical protein
MKRHSALIPLSHDHHHALVEARRLRRAADSDEDPEPVAAAFADFFVAVNVPHFREEVETLFPLVADFDEARPLVVEALPDHQRLHALVAELRRSSEVRRAMREIGELLEAVFVFLVVGSVTIKIDDEVRDLGPGDAVIIAKGRRRKITAGRGGARYLSVHLRRPPLQIQTRAHPRRRDP